MRRIIPVALAAAIALSIPATASARGGDDDRDDRDERTGEIASFTGSVLTIRFDGGRTTSAAVTNATRIRCRGGESTATAARRGRRGRDKRRCGADQLVAGRAIHEAELRGSGRTWRGVDVLV